jgi:hypothetical protein
MLTRLASDLFSVGSRVQSLRSSPAQPRLASRADGQRYKVSADQDSEAMTKRLYDAWLL